ncbi:Pol-like 5 isoform 1 [Hibiscus syriacus]|uniref:Pol-like 5 isoform 1 n=1 Tax=Hibiscus syriacus TaxID=106335 RepID=A0A6A3CKA1_HIBSY|nr:Pol-like 5 isoform 1 [Hibiscus syriacus]
MAVSFLISHIAHLTFFYSLLLSSSASSPTAVTDLNITSILSSFQNLTSFSSLLSSTSVASDLTRRQYPITLLAVPNTYLSIHPFSDLTLRLPPSSLGDILRYHILLQYFSWTDLLQIPPFGILVTTLLQTTGRAPGNFGAVNITRNPLTNAITIQSPSPDSASKASVLSLIKTLPYNITILAVNSLIVPYDFNLMASETRPPLGLNITEALIDGHNFNVAAAMLAALASSMNSKPTKEELGSHSLSPPTVLSAICRETYGNRSIVCYPNGFRPKSRCHFRGFQGFVAQRDFGKDSTGVIPKLWTTVQPPELSPSRENSAWLISPASSPEGFHEGMNSEGQIFRARSCILALYCIVLYLLV